MDLLPVRERIAAINERDKLETNLGGVADMQRPPDAVFVVDLKTEAIGVREANRLKIPIIGLVDTNCDPDPVQFVIPGNDDAIRSCKIIIDGIADVARDNAQAFRAAGGGRPARARGAGAQGGGGEGAARGRGAGAPRGRGASPPRGGGGRLLAGRARNPERHAARGRRGRRRAPRAPHVRP